MKYRNVIFDIGRVLFDYRWKEMFMDYGLEEEEALRVGNLIFADPEELWHEMDLGNRSVEDITEEYVRRFPKEEEYLRWFIAHGEYMQVPRPKVWKKVHEELDELQTELEKDDRQRSTEELGDFLFSVINAARLYKLNPDNALEITNQKFIRRFNYIERHSIRAGRPLTEMTLEEMDNLWNEAKQEEEKSKNRS